MVGGGGATKCHVLGILVSDVFDCVGCVVWCMIGDMYWGGYGGRWVFVRCWCFGKAILWDVPNISPLEISVHHFLRI